MVKGFDSTQSDPSKIFLDYILSFFDKNSLHISPKKADLLIKEWIKNSSSTSWVYSRFASM